MKKPRKNHDQRALDEKGQNMEDAIMEAGNRAMQRLIYEMKSQDRSREKPTKPRE